MATTTVDLSSMDDGTQIADIGQTTDVDQSQVTSDDGHQQGDQSVQVDGRRGPTDIRTAAKSIADAIADPSSDLAAQFPGQEKAVKALADSYFRADAYAKVFPRVEDAQAAKIFIDTVGGLDGFQQIQQRMQGYDAQEAGLESGDPTVLDSFFEDYPEGAALLAPAYLDRLARINPEAFSNTIAPHAIGMLERAGIGNHIAQMVAETEPARKQQMAQQLDQWMKTQKQNVSQLQSAAPKHPLDDKLKQRETAQQQREDQFFQSQVDSAVNQRASGDITKTVDQYAKTYKLNDVQKSRFAASVTQRIVNEMLSDDTFKKQDGIRKSSKDRNVDNVATFRASEFLRRLPTAAFNEAQELWGPNKGVAQPTGVVKPGGAKTAPGGGPLLISRAPDISELDMSKDPRQLLYIQNRGYRRDGTFVTWK